jgi:hypothetical protein
MQQPLRIEVPDEEHAASLRRFLQRYDVETRTMDGHCEISVDFVEPERRITDVLNAIDQWLPTAGLPLVKLHLDGSSYTLSAPAGTTTDAA